MYNIGIKKRHAKKVYVAKNDIIIDVKNSSGPQSIFSHLPFNVEKDKQTKQSSRR